MKRVLDRIWVRRGVVFLIPLALAGVVILVSPASEPEPARASVAPAPASPAGIESSPPMSSARPGLEGSDAAAYDAEVERLASLGAVSAPFGVETGEPTSRDEPGAGEPGRAEPETRELRLTSVMAGGGGGVSVINGAICRVGDEPVPGWVVRMIDAQARRVVVQSPGGERVELTQRSPLE